MNGTEKVPLSCIICPRSCQLEVNMEGSEVVSIDGFGCNRGKAYAQEEMVAPKRMLTLAIPVKNGQLPVLPVVSKEGLPKEKIMECAEFLRNFSVTAPITEGQVVVPNILDLGVDIIAARDIQLKMN